MAPTDFVELDTIRDPEGLIVGKITFKPDSTGHRRYSFAILREVSHGTEIGHTHWMRRRHVNAMRQLLDRLEERLVAEEEQARVDVLRAPLRVPMGAAARR